MNVVELNEPVKWFPVCHGASVVETLVRPPQFVQQQQTVIERSGDPFLEVNSRSELVDQESGDSWDDEEDDFMDEKEPDEYPRERANDLLAFAERATFRLRSFVCRNEGREDYRPVYDERDSPSFQDAKRAKDIYYADALGAGRFNGVEAPLGSANGAVSARNGKSVSTGRSYAGIPSTISSANSCCPSRSVTLQAEIEKSNSTCHWHCTGLANKSRGLGPLEELFTALIALPAPTVPPLTTTTTTAVTNDFYDRSLEEERNCYYYDDKMYELLMANEADATAAFWNGTVCERSAINNLSDFPFL